MNTSWKRRDFLKLTAGAVAGSALWRPGHLLAATESDAKMWKQFSGTTLNFISENTSPSSAIAANLKPFTDLTGMKVNVTQLQLGDVVQKVALDFGSGQSTYPVIYADPYQILAPYHEGFEDLNKFAKDSSLPQVPGAIKDFIPTQFDADGRFGDGDAFYTLPYDCPTMVWIYRKDLFAKHQAKMQQDLGFDPTPSGNLTWEQYYKIAEWFNQNAKADVAYGTGHQAKQYDSLMCDFSNVLLAYGADYFKDGEKLGLRGSTNPGACTADSAEGIAAAEFYQKLLAIAHPGSTSWDWDGVAQAFKAGQIAMHPNWHEFAASYEQTPLLTGKVGYALLPKGPKRSANMYGGTGIGISKAAPDKVKKASWLFLVWATSVDTQLDDLKSKVGGGTPTRLSIYERPDVKKAQEGPSDMPNMLGAKAALEAWKPGNIGLRPKIAKWNECDTIIFTEVSKMLSGGGQGADATMHGIKKQIDQANGA